MTQLSKYASVPVSDHIKKESFFGRIYDVTVIAIVHRAFNNTRTSDKNMKFLTLDPHARCQYTTIIYCEFHGKFQPNSIVIF